MECGAQKVGWVVAQDRRVWGGDIVLSLAETAGSTAFNGPGLEEKET